MEILLELPSLNYCLTINNQITVQSNSDKLNYTCCSLISYQTSNVFINNQLQNKVTYGSSTTCRLDILNNNISDNIVKRLIPVLA